MSRHLILLPIAATLVAAACGRGGSETVPATVPGSYVYAAKGSTLRKPWEFSALLELTPDKRFRLTFDKTIEGHKDPTETATGTYTISGDRIELHEGSGPLESTHDVHKLRIKADSLVAEVGWTAEIFLKGVGAPNIVFVKERRG
jgi:lipopolysaccharide assembly outer membrane protein LptD (OstA)